MEIKKIDYYKMIIGFLFFFFGGTLLVSILRSAFGMNLSSENLAHVAYIDLGVSFVSTLVLILLYGNVLKRDGKKLKGQYGGLFKFFGKILLAFVIFMAAKIGAGVLQSIAFAIAHVEVATAENQSLILEILAKYPLVMITSACLLAPIEEEVLFRCGIKQIIKNKKVFVTVSGLIFGLMHVTGAKTLLAEILLLGVIISLIACSDMNKGKKFMAIVMSCLLIMIIFVGIYYYQYGNLVAVIKGIDKVEAISSISYIAMGIMLAFFYQKEDNIYYTIGVHALNNIFGMVLSLLF